MSASERLAALDEEGRRQFNLWDLMNALPEIVSVVRAAEPLVAELEKAEARATWEVRAATKDSTLRASFEDGPLGQLRAALAALDEKLANG